MVRRTKTRKRRMVGGFAMDNMSHFIKNFKFTQDVRKDLQSVKEQIIIPINSGEFNDALNTIDQRIIHKGVQFVHNPSIARVRRAYNSLNSDPSRQDYQVEVIESLKRFQADILERFKTESSKLQESSDIVQKARKNVAGPPPPPLSLHLPAQPEDASVTRISSSDVPIVHKPAAPQIQRPFGPADASPSAIVPYTASSTPSLPTVRSTVEFAPPQFDHVQTQCELKYRNLYNKVKDGRFNDKDILVMLGTNDPDLPAFFRDIQYNETNKTIADVPINEILKTCNADHSFNNPVVQTIQVILLALRSSNKPSLPPVLHIADVPAPARPWKFGDTYDTTQQDSDVSDDDEPIAPQVSPVNLQQPTLNFKPNMYSSANLPFPPQVPPGGLQAPPRGPPPRGPPRGPPSGLQQDSNLKGINLNFNTPPSKRLPLPIFPPRGPQPNGLQAPSRGPPCDSARLRQCESELARITAECDANSAQYAERIAELEATIQATHATSDATQQQYTDILASQQKLLDAMSTNQDPNALGPIIEKLNAIEPQVVATRALLDTKSNELKSTLGHLETTLDQKISATSHTIQELTALNSTQQAETRQLRTDFTTKFTELQSEFARRNDRDVLSAIQVLRSEHQDAMRQQTSATSKLARELENARAALASANSEKDTTSKELAAKKAELVSKTSQFSQQIFALHAKIRDTEQRLAAEKSERDKANSSAERVADENRQQLSTIENAHHADLFALRSLLEQQQASVKANSDAQQTELARITAAEQAKRQELADAKTAAAASAATAAAELAAARNNLHDVTTRMQSAQQAAVTAQAAAAAANARDATDFQTQLASANAEVARANKERQDAEIRATTVTSTASAAAAERDAALRRMQEDYATSLAELRNQQGESQKSAAETQNTIRQITNQLASANDAIARLQPAPCIPLQLPEPPRVVGRRPDGVVYPGTTISIDWSANGTTGPWILRVWYDGGNIDFQEIPSADTPIPYVIKRSGAMTAQILNIV